MNERTQQSEGKEEVLYNGIRLPVEWPPRGLDPDSWEPPPVPYLDSPPPVIPIDVGRQLFVDDFLVEENTLVRTFHRAEKCEHNPLLVPETELEAHGGYVDNDPLWRPGSAACPFDDGVFYDPQDGLFKMWYIAGVCRNTALAYSPDGIHWQRPALDVVPGTNCVLPYDPQMSRDNFSPWLDYGAASPEERYKAFLYTRTVPPGEAPWLLTSPDGVHWRRRVRIAEQQSIGDGTNLFYNPFRKKWVLGQKRTRPKRRRLRYYWEHADFFGLGKEYDLQKPVYWVGADKFDIPDPEIQKPTQLYALAVVAYESIMLGVFTIHYGAENPVYWERKAPKLTQIKLGFSRDGFHWDRPNREVFISATKRDGDWDRGYLRAAQGGCLIVGDRLHFYYCGFSGVSPRGERHMYAGGSTHLALLRRDGFASMDAGLEGGSLTTRPVIFKGKHLFVNADASQGELRVEVLEADGRPIAPFVADSCEPLHADDTCQPVKWKTGDDLSALTDRAVRFRFHLRNAKLYAFWVSPKPSGASFGYVAAGGPGFTGPVDTAGTGGGRDAI